MYDDGNNPNECRGILRTDPCAEHCADEDMGSCTGPGRVYFGAVFEGEWKGAYKDLDAGESIECSYCGWGCNPLWDSTKECYS